MTIGFLFWLLVILAIIFGFWPGPPESHPSRPYYRWGSSLLLLVLFVLLGISVYGWPIKG